MSCCRLTMSCYRHGLRALRIVFSAHAHSSPVRPVFVPRAPFRLPTTFAPVVCLYPHEAAVKSLIVRSGTAPIGDRLVDA
jgi:hypothetical protein